MHAEVYIRPVKQFQDMSQRECCQGQVQHQEQDSARQLCQKVISVLSHVQREPRVLESDMSAGAESESDNEVSRRSESGWSQSTGPPTSTSTCSSKKVGCCHHVDGTSAEVKSSQLNVRGRCSRRAETTRTPSISWVPTVASPGDSHKREQPGET